MVAEALYYTEVVPLANLVPAPDELPKKFVSFYFSFATRAAASASSFSRFY